MRDKKVTPPELRVLEALWDEPPLTVGQVIERLKEHTDWHKNTIQTLLTRLVRKKVVARRKDGRRFFYSPLIARDEYLAQESEGLLNRFFDGEVAPLVAHFADTRKLSRQDIEEIEAILDELKNRDD